jgi:D-proline reductase (dithiol) PrdB
MAVDSFKYLPRIIAAFYQSIEIAPYTSIPWTPLPGSIEDCVFGLVTSAGLYDKQQDPPFDTEREKGEPTWGDPTYRVLPPASRVSSIGVSHLHLNTSDIERDVNVVYPIERMQGLMQSGVIGGLAENNYSFMGFQGFPPDTSAWETEYGPAIARAFLNAGVQCVILTPA